MNFRSLIVILFTLCLVSALPAKDQPAVPSEWPAKDAAAGFTVEQEGDGQTKIITVTEKSTGKKLELSADNRGAPQVLAPYNGWPQIGLINDGPPEFLWRRLYRVEEGEYDIARIDELTRIASQAPENAPVVAISPGYRLRFLRTRVDDEIGPHSFEAFVTETPSPDGKSKVRFHYEPDRLAKVDMVSAQSGDEAQVLNGMEDEFRDTYGYAKWRPDSGAVALYTKDAMRVGSTKLFLRKGGSWEESELPEVKLPLKKGAMDRIRTEFIKPVKWSDEHTLVMLIHGDLRSNEDGPDSFAFQATLRWGKDGKPKVVGVKSVPESSVDE